MTGIPEAVAVDGVRREYAWGSTSAIQELLGERPDGRPLAELWFGTHPDSPAHVPGLDTTLEALIESDPAAALGGAAARRFAGRLPFLVKLLAAAKPLSIQVHPTRPQAEAGFDREDARGVGRDAAERNYRDRNHKPELLCALSPFDALCGFRPIGDTLRLLAALDVPELQPVRRLLSGTDGLRAAFTYLLELPEPGPLVAAVAARAKAPVAPEWGGVLEAVALAAAAFPGDVGVVLGLLLNHVRLQPGEAIYLPAGNVHAYLRGLGVEVMAASDNVLRCGLTPKHVDAEELLRVTEFTELAEPIWPAESSGFGVHFQVPAPEFRLDGVDLDAYRKPGRPEGSCATGGVGKPYLVLCASGSVRVQVGRTTVALTPGHAAFVPAREPTFALAGTGQTFLATVRDAQGP